MDTIMNIKIDSQSDSGCVYRVVDKNPDLASLSLLA